MDQFLIAVFGVQNHLSTAQEGARAVLIFSYGLLLLRLSGPRMFGHWSALDIVISIIVGSALARAMTGIAPLLGTDGRSRNHDVPACCSGALGGAQQSYSARRGGRGRYTH